MIIVVKRSFIIFGIAWVLMGIPGANAQQASKDSLAYNFLVGSWQGRDQAGANGLIRFKQDTTVEIMTADISFRDTTVNQALIKLFFEVNTHTQPIWLDLVMKASVGHSSSWIEIKRMRGILRFLSPDQIELRLTPDDKGRYSSFDTELFEEEESMILTRIKERPIYSSL